MSKVTDSSRYHVADRAPRTIADLVLRWETILVALLILAASAYALWLAHRLRQNLAAQRESERRYASIAAQVHEAIMLVDAETGHIVEGNPLAARYCGINLARQQLTVYTVSGAVSGLCGYLWVSRYGIAYSDIALGYELTVIAACVIGGVSIAGGVGTVPGALLGALFLGVIVNALPVINVSPFWQMAISGAVILAAVIVNSRSERRAGKLILPEARRKAASVSGIAPS